MQTVTLIMAIGVFAFIAHHDVTTRRIPNEATLAIALLGAIRMVLADDLDAAMLTLAAATVIFAVGLFLLWTNVLGGGDVKLIAATTFLIGYHDLWRFLILMSLCGSMLAFSCLLQRRRDSKLPWSLPHVRLSAMKALEERQMLLHQSTIPYGVAIAAAGSTILIIQS